MNQRNPMEPQQKNALQKPVQNSLKALFAHLDYPKWIQRHEIDLHIHSSFSDGSDSIETLLEKIRKSGLKVFSLTDHDNVEGVEKLLSILNEEKNSSVAAEDSMLSTAEESPLSVTDHRSPLAVEKSSLCFIPGIEFSCKLSKQASVEAGVAIYDPDGKVRKSEFHILGYGMDIHHPAFQKAVRINKENREKKLEERIHFLAQNGYPQLGEEDIALIAANNPNPGKPHIVNRMAELGLIIDLRTIENKENTSSTESVFISDYPKATSDDIFTLLSSIHSQYTNLTPGQAIQAIREAGGIAVLAHGIKGGASDNLTREEMDQRVRYLLGFGLQGLECYYSPYEETGYTNGFTAEQQEIMLELADRYGLIPTAGSDYHGSNKPAVLLGRKILKTSETEVT